MTEFVQVQTTTARREEAETIAAELVEKRLAACVQIVGPISSTYRWEGEVATAPEWLLLVKTTAAAYETVAESIGLLHSYEVPEIIVLPILCGGEAYLQWLGQQVQ